ncbi:60 kDa chaperonin [Striga asiatica]|uniref:60 kDa chaperonin n=1 Tax=Striga asiatica TaxID=4170 RepID=A0A5A7QH22_STRAF|nr:60 kDa chaperonin [Striga asiatica]
MDTEDNVTVTHSLTALLPRYASTGHVADIQNIKVMAGGRTLLWLAVGKIKQIRVAGGSHTAALEADDAGDRLLDREGDTRIEPGRKFDLSRWHKCKSRRLSLMVVVGKEGCCS